MTRIGTNMAIEFSTTVGSAQHMRQTGSKVLAISIMIIEKFDGDIDYAICRQAVAKKIRDFHVICLKFYRKRATCKCLKDVHLESRKALPKHARCDHCEVVKERRLLMVCSRCRIDQYCSRKCQVEGWDNTRGIARFVSLFACPLNKFVKTALVVRRICSYHMDVEMMLSESSKYWVPGLSPNDIRIISCIIFHEHIW